MQRHKATCLKGELNQAKKSLQSGLSHGVLDQRGGGELGLAWLDLTWHLTLLPLNAQNRLGSL
jgi:hypothetical protein